MSNYFYFNERGETCDYESASFVRVEDYDKLEAENERLRAALENALLWTDEENDVSDWRDEAQQALKGE